MPPVEPPLWTPDLPGAGGALKQQPEDFEVEEIPAYEPAGVGEFLYLWVEKRDVGAAYFLREVSRRLNVPSGEVGTAGLKDRRAVTRQWVSVPASAEPNLPQLDGGGIRVLRVSRHGNKLRPGHLHGNRFRILARGADFAKASAVVDRLNRDGLPNFYGPQRFGRGGETLELGQALLRGEQRRCGAFLRKLALSAAQSALFNDYLSRRLNDGLLRTVLPGDVLGFLPAGALFRAEDVAKEQPRFDARQVVTCGPMFGRKTFPAEAAAAERELRVLTDSGLSPTSFLGFGKLLMGTRRHNLLYPEGLAAEAEPEGVRFTLTLPAGSYATVLLREVLKLGWDDMGGDGE